MTANPSGVEVAGASDAAGLLANARALVPLLADEAAESERLRRPTDTAIRALAEAGVFRAMVPRAYGGLEIDLDTFLELGLTLGEADASLAWVSNFYVEHNWMLCQFPESFQRTLYAEPDHILAPATIAPTGEARAVDGGFRISGRWKWGTGVTHASWVIVSGAVGTDDRLDFRFFALPIDEVKVEDTWYVDGMIGTGSNDVVVDDRFVPEARTVSLPPLLTGHGEGARLHTGPLYRTPMIPILMVAAGSPVIGQARTAVAGFRERLTGQTRMHSPAVQASKPSAQIRLARATLEVRQAELLMRDVVAEVCALRDAATPTDRARWSSSIAHAVHQSRDVVQDVALASGARAHLDSHPLQRAVRDVNVAASHVVFDVDTQRELYGRMLLGLDPNALLF